MVAGSRGRRGGGRGPNGLNRRRPVAALVAAENGGHDGGVPAAVADG